MDCHGSSELWSPLWKPSSHEEQGEGPSVGGRGRSSFPRCPWHEPMGTAELLFHVLSPPEEGWCGWESCGNTSGQQCETPVVAVEGMPRRGGEASPHQILISTAERVAGPGTEMWTSRRNWVTSFTNQAWQMASKLILNVHVKGSHKTALQQLWTCSLPHFSHSNSQMYFFFQLCFWNKQCSVLVVLPAFIWEN